MLVQTGGRLPALGASRSGGRILVFTVILYASGVLTAGGRALWFGGRSLVQQNTGMTVQLRQFAEPSGFDCSARQAACGFFGGRPLSYALGIPLLGKYGEHMAL